MLKRNVRCLLVSCAIGLSIGYSTCTASAENLSENATTIYNKIGQSSAFIVSKDSKGSFSTGSGFCIGSHDNTAYLITNKHVVGNDASPGVILVSDKTSVLSGRVIRVSTLDAVVIAVTDTNCVPLTLSRVIPQVGTEIGIAGFPDIQVKLMQGDLSKLAPSFHVGTINAIPADGGFVEYDAQTDHGNSGSPLFDLKTGVVYGMVTLAYTGKTGALQNNLALAIPSLSSFIDHTAANAAYDGREGAVTSPVSAIETKQSEGERVSLSSSSRITDSTYPYVKTVETVCGAGSAVEAFDSSNRVTGEFAAAEYGAVITDSKAEIVKLSPCVYSLSVKCPNASAPCDDAPWMWAIDHQLFLQIELRSSLARSFPSSSDSFLALRNEMTTALQMCQSPNINSSGDPYPAAKQRVLITLRLVQKLRVGAPVNQWQEPNLIAGCGQQLNERI